jgi:hypothetical protein
MAQSVGEWTAEVDGMVHGLILVCTSMIAAYPEREQVLGVLKNLISDKALEQPGDNAETKSYKRGIHKVAATLQQAVKAAQLQAEKPESTKH